MLHHELSGPEGAPVLVLAHSLATNLRLWDPQLPALEAQFRVLRYDARGHGRSQATPGPYSIELLARDVLELMRGLAIERAHFCGLSIGGLVGMWLGAHAPESIDKLVLANTAARIGTRERWDARIRDVLRNGTRHLAPDLIARWFTPAFRERAPEVVAAAARMLQQTSAEGYAGCAAAIRDADLGPSLAAIRAPTLVIAGREDPATTPDEGRALARAIAGARFCELPASHLSNLEAPEAFSAELVRLLAG
jgi:3-oxoadipate enol-lactonase